MSRLLKTPVNRTALLRIVIEGVLVILLVLLGLRMLFDFNAKDNTQNQDPALLVPDQSSSIGLPLEPDTYDILTLSNPFSDVEREEQINDNAILNAPETDLNLKLKGSRATGEGQGVAYVLLPDGSQELARVGVELLDGVVVEYVFEDRITLSTRDGLETLYRLDPENRAVSTPSVEVPGETEEAGLAIHGDGTSAKRFVDDVSFALVEDNGIPEGYRLTAKRQSGALQAAGFKEGDIMLEVNEFPVSEIDVADLQDLLLASTVFEFYIERDEKTELVIVEFAQGVEN